MTGLIARIGPFGRRPGSESGAASVELAFVILLLLPIIMGIYDFGRYGLAQSRVVSAARAGTQYGLQDASTAGDLDGMIAAARADAGAAAGALEVTAGRYFQCPGEAPEAAYAGPCPDGDYPPLYVSVTVRESLEMMFAYPGIQSPIVVGSTSAIRVR